MRRVLVAALGLVLAAACGTGGGTGAGGDDGRVTVVAGFYPLAEAAARVGGDHVRVVNLTAAGAEPHDLELSTADVDRLEDADLVLYLGGGFQPAVEKVARRRRGPSVDLLDAVALEPGGPGTPEAAEPGGGAGAEAGEDGHGEPGHDDGETGHDGEDGHGEDGADPHFWLDPVRLAAAVERIEAALARIAPEHAGAFAANAAAYREELEALDQELRDGLRDCERRTIVTAHAAFHHLAQRYGLVQEPITGLSPEAEPDPKRLDELVEVVRRHGVTTVFTEVLVPPRVAEALAREAGVEVAVLDPVEGLTREQLRQGATYASVMRENLAALRSALGCR